MLDVLRLKDPLTNAQQVFRENLQRGKDEEASHQEQLEAELQEDALHELSILWELQELRNDALQRRNAEKQEEPQNAGL